MLTVKGDDWPASVRAGVGVTVTGTTLSPICTSIDLSAVMTKVASITFWDRKSWLSTPCQAARHALKKGSAVMMRAVSTRYLPSGPGTWLNVTVPSSMNKTNCPGSTGLPLMTRVYLGVGVGVGSGVGAGVGVGSGVAVVVGEGVDVGKGVAVGVGAGVGVGNGVAVGVGTGVGTGVALGVGTGVGVAVAEGVGVDGVEVAVGGGTGVGVGFGSIIVRAKMLRVSTSASAVNPPRSTVVTNDVQVSPS